MQGDCDAEALYCAISGDTSTSRPAHCTGENCRNIAQTILLGCVDGRSEKNILIWHAQLKLSRLYNVRFFSWRSLCFSFVRTFNVFLCKRCLLHGSNPCVSQHRRLLKTSIGLQFPMSGRLSRRIASMISGDSSNQNKFTFPRSHDGSG